jgi:ATP-dependent Lon protease
MKFDDILDLVVIKDLEAGKIPMLLGEPGIGKSSWCEELVNNKMRTKLFVLACNQLADKADVTGARLVPTADKQSYMQTFYPHQVIQEAIAYAKDHPHETPVLFMDELNRTTPDVTSELLSIPTMRAIGSVKLPENLRVIIAGNDKGNVTSLDEASVSRFVLYHVQPDVETFLALDSELNPFVRAVLEQNPRSLFCKTIADASDEQDNGHDEDIDDLFADTDDGMDQFTTPRTISGLSKWLNLFTNDELRLMMATPSTESDDDSISVLQESIEGHVGHTWFAALLLHEIQQNVAKVNNQSNNVKVNKPAEFEQLKSATTMDEMSDMMDSIPSERLFGVLVYALFYKSDNSRLIKQLAPRVTNYVASDINTLMQLASSDNLDPDNVSTFMATDAPMATTLKVVLVH